MNAIKQELTWICQEHASVNMFSFSNWTPCLMAAAIDILTLNRGKVYQNVLVHVWGNVVQN